MLQKNLTRTEASNFRKLSIVAMSVMLLAGCGVVGGPTIDATNADTLRSSLASMVAKMPESERARFGQDLIAVFEGAVYPDRPQNISLFSDKYERMLGGGYSSPSEIVTAIGTKIHGKNPSEVHVLATEARAQVYESAIGTLRENQNTVQSLIADATQLKSNFQASLQANNSIRESFNALIVEPKLTNIQWREPKVGSPYNLRYELRFKVRNITDRLVPVTGDGKICSMRMEFGIADSGRTKKNSGYYELTPLGLGQMGDELVFDNVEIWEPPAPQNLVINSVSVVQFSPCAGNSFFAVDQFLQRGGSQDDVDTCDRALTVYQNRLNEISGAITQFEGLKTNPRDADVGFPTRLGAEARYRGC